MTPAPSQGPSGANSDEHHIAGRVLPIARAEELIGSLEGVSSCRIVSDASGAIEAIHVLVVGGTVAKSMVRNIESALMAQLGLKVDHRKISVATSVKRSEPSGEVAVTGTTPPVVTPVYGTPAYGTPAAGVPAKGAITGEVPVMVSAPVVTPVVPVVPVATTVPAEVVPGRGLLFEDVEIRGSRSKGVTCRVTLRYGDEEYVGEAEGMETDRSRVELSARAALAAVAAAGGPESKLSLEGAKVITAFDRELVLVGVNARMGRSAQLLTGSCVLKESAETSAALAVLNATNRWVEGIR